jgi:ribosomal-protein-alanine N-acetyltransferase
MSIAMHIITPRMHLIPATLELLHAELQSPATLSAFIGAYVPAHWPPEHYDEPAIRWTIAQLSKPKADGRWYLHYFVLLSKTNAPDVVIGAGGYTGAPDPAGVVTIGYSILPEYQRRGLASEAVAGLIQNAFLKQIKVVAADTFESDPRSGGVLLKNGFRLVGAGADPGTARYELTRSEWKARLTPVAAT